MRAAVAEIVAQAGRCRRRRRQRRRDEQAELRDLREGPARRLRRHAATRSSYADLVDFPELQQKVFGDPGRSRRKTPACNAPISVRDPQAAAADVEHLKAALAASGQGGVHERRLARRDRAVLPQRPLPDARGVLYAIAEAMRAEYEAMAQRRLRAADRLPGPGDGPAHPVSPTSTSRSSARRRS